MTTRRWAYLDLTLDTRPDLHGATLRAYAAAGWELVGTIRHGDRPTDDLAPRPGGRYAYVLRRAA
jgi:hypothetical protein